MLQLAAFLVGTALGVTSAASLALLLYTQRGFLGTAGFLFALTFAALALGLWVGAETVSARRRWIAAIVALGAAALFSLLWMQDEGFRKMSLAGALAAFFLLAEPAYTGAAAYRTINRKDSAVSAFFGAALGVLLATLFLIPRLHPSVIFVGAAALLLVVALLIDAAGSQQTDTDGLALNGKTAVVTGVSDRGQVGFAVAQKLLSLGAQVCVTARRPEITELARELGTGVVGVQCDLTNDDDVARLVATARERFGRIDVLVNVAGGLTVIKPLAETTPEEWQGEQQRNAETVFRVTRAALASLRETRGTVINFASPAGQRAVAQLGAYSAAKAAVVAFTRALAIEEKKHGVRVNAIAPGMIDTEQNRKSVVDPAKVKWVSREDVSNVVAFLASAESAGITGETIQVLGEGIQ